MIVVVLTAFTLIAFAANSVLCRFALGDGLIDPITFTTIRIVSGAIVLVPLAGWFGRGGARGERGTWRSGIALFAYAIAFSLAYVSLPTGVGALVLFGCVQLTMMAGALRSGERPGKKQWTGFGVAFGGLVVLVMPGLAAPDPLGAFAMGIAGIAWGVYSLAGKGSVQPVVMTAGNFVRASPFALAAGAIALGGAHVSAPGALLAITSGTVTSGLGYALWYRALPHLSRTQASVVQLLVPVIAAMAGIALLGEVLTARAVVASALILGGVLFAVTGRRA